MKILMLSPVNPYPPNDGAKVRIKNIYEQLSKDHKVILITNNEERTNKGKIIRIINLIKSIFGKYPYHYYLWNNPDLHDRVCRTISSGDFDLIYCHFIYLIPLIIGYKTKIVVDTHNVDHEIWERKFDYYLSIKCLSKMLISKINYYKILAFEKKIFNYVDGIVSVSKHDESCLKGIISGRNIRYFIAPNGVSLKEYTPKKKTSLKKVVLGFLGSMDLELNQDAAWFLIERIFPKLKEVLPCIDISVLIIGKNPPQSLFEYSQKNPCISVTGTVENVSDYLDQIDILVLPLKSGAGTKLRVFEAFAKGIPIVGSWLAFIGVDDLVNRQNIFIAESVEDYINVICELIAHPEKISEIGDSCRYLVEQKYDWGIIGKELSSNLMKAFFNDSKSL